MHAIGSSYFVAAFEIYCTILKKEYYQVSGAMSIQRKNDMRKDRSFKYRRFNIIKNDQCPSHIETSQLICSANQLTGFYMRGILVVKGLIRNTIISTHYYWQ